MAGGINAGEFFINLGIKGGEGTLGMVSKTKEGFGELKSMAIESKAAILAALYALEKIVSTSGELGTTLKNFQSVSGIAPEVLQRYQYAAMKAGVANDSLLQSFLKLQSMAFDVRAGKGLPEWMAPIITTLAQHGKPIGPDWPARWQKDPTLGLQALSQFALLSDIDTSTKALALQRAGMAPDLAAALMRGMLTPGKLSDVPKEIILSEKEIIRLDALNQKFNQGLKEVGSTLNATFAGRGWDENVEFIHKMSEGIARRRKEHAEGKSFYIKQQINVHGHADPKAVKKAAHDGVVEGAGKIISTLPSAQTSH